MWESLNQSISQFCSSKFWDTDLTWNSEDPDFTICFEKTFLLWIPCAFFWLFLPLQIYTICKTRSFKIGFNLYNIFKLVLIAALVIIALTDTIITYRGFFDHRHNIHHVQVDILASAIKVFTFALLFVITLLNIRRGIRTSGTVFVFLFLLVICGAPQFRSELRLAYKNEINFVDEGFITYLVYYPLIVTLFLLNCFVDARPTVTTFPLFENVCPENHVSFLSQLLFSWFDGFMWTGYKRPITDDDIWNLDYDMDPKEVAREFEPHWHSAFERSKKASKSTPRLAIRVLDRLKRIGKGQKIDYDTLDHKTDDVKREASVLGPLFRTFGWEFTFGVSLKVFQSCLQFVSPKVLKLLIAFVSDKEEVMWHGYLYSLIFLLVSVLQVLLLMKHLHLMYSIGIRMRTALITIIYKKALKISNGAKKDFTLGQIVNLMSVDAQRFLDLMMFVPLLFVVPLEILLCMYFLWDIIGLSVLAGLVLLILLMPLNAIIANGLRKLQVTQMKRKDDRVKMMTEILSGMKVLKLYAWEPSFEKEVVQIRNSEIDILKKSSYLYASSTFLYTCTPFLVTLVTFAVFVLSGNVLDAEITFVSLSLFNILRFPLTVIPIVISFVVQTFVAVKRINKYMNSEELDPQAVSHEPSPEPVTIENGQFSWNDEREAPALGDINMRVQKGSLVAVVGPVGGGKSSLLSAILGEMYKQSGSVNTYGKIAYVPQQAWIRNATLKDNITFGDNADNSFYREVVDACSLKPDFKMLPGGDQTEVGEKGVNLSGGQKQRISLARAVFSKSDIYLLDDPLSAVDSHVGKHIFDRVIGPNGLLNGKTRIFVTHGLTYLPQVDHIIVLVDGFVTEAGTYDELMQSGKGFYNFLTTHQTKENGDLDKEEDTNQAMTETDLRVGSPVDEEFTRAFFRSLSSPKIDDLNLTDHEPMVVGQKLIETEKAETGNVKWNVIKYYLIAANSTLVILTLSMNLLYQIFSVASNIWLSEWSSDTTIVVNGHQDMDKEYLYLSVYGVFGLAQAISIFTQVIAMYQGMLRAGNYIHKLLLTSVLRWPVTTFDTIPSGRIINRFGFDVDILDNTMPQNLMQLLNGTAAVLSTLFMICYSTPIFIAVILPMGLIYFCIQRFYAATSRQLKRLESVSKSPVYSHFGETVTGATSIRAYGLQSEFIETSDDKVAINQRCSHLYYVASRWLAVRLELLGSFIVLFASLFVVFQRYTIDASLVGLSVSYALQITEILFYWAKVLTETETNVVAVERIKEYSEVEQEAPWTLPDKDETIPKDWPEKGEIGFQDFSVRYREGLGLVLKGITFQVNGGEKVGIVGRTGAGKSSLSLCLFRLLESAGGSIIIDGLDVSKMGLHTLRSRLTIIPQDPVLFTGKLRLNLDPGLSYSDESVWNALELANLKTVVSNLGSGLQHEITEGGGNFSVGQRQLICLARALLRKTKILILDEATAAVDLDTDESIQNTIKKEFADCTVLTIAHRLNTVMDYDRIIVLDGGRLVEYDSPETLLQSQKSIFYSMAADAGLV